jgi:hypothetical protein
MMTLIAHERPGVICLYPGDTLAVTYTDVDGRAHPLLHTPITQTMRVTDVKIYRFENEFELKFGYFAVLGEQ